MAPPCRPDDLCSAPLRKNRKGKRALYERIRNTYISLFIHAGNIDYDYYDNGTQTFWKRNFGADSGDVGESNRFRCNATDRGCRLFYSENKIRKGIKSTFLPHGCIHLLVIVIIIPAARGNIRKSTIENRKLKWPGTRDFFSLIPYPLSLVPLFPYYLIPYPVLGTIILPCI